MKEVKDYNLSKDPRLIDCKTECGNERCFAKRYGLFAEKTCPNYKDPSLRTNADRIRAMTDEELAKWLDLLVNRAKIYGENKVWLEDTPRYYIDWLGWLKQEVEE